jgi:hypothetical protein
MELSPHGHSRHEVNKGSLRPEQHPETLGRYSSEKMTYLTHPPVQTFGPHSSSQRKKGEGVKERNKPPVIPASARIRGLLVSFRPPAGREKNHALLDPKSVVAVPALIVRVIALSVPAGCVLCPVSPILFPSVLLRSQIPFVLPPRDSRDAKTARHQAGAGVRPNLLSVFSHRLSLTAL